MPDRIFEKLELIRRVLAHGRFVLHGSNVDDLRWIEPTSASGRGQGMNRLGVYATEDVADAIFYAVLDRTKVRWFSGRQGEYWIDPVEGVTAPWVAGAVYVLDRGDFELVRGDLRSTTAVRAVGKVAVTVDDFPYRDQVRRQTRAGWLAARADVPG